MGILTFLLSKTEKKPKDLARNVVRRKAIALFLSVGGASWLFFLVSLIALSLLPLAVKKLRPDENALGIGQMSRTYSDNDFSTFISHNLKMKNDQSLKIDFIVKEFEKLRLKTSTQKFSLVNNYTGYNTFGILRAPRADGTESIVISAPWKCADGKDNHIGIGLLVGLANFASKKSMWAKDLVFLVVDKSPTGSLAWLNAYHGIPDSKGTIKGVIQGALNLEFCGNEDNFSGAGLYPINVNGQLPNADLIATLVYSFYYESVPLWLHDQMDVLSYKNQHLREYLENGRNLLSFFWNQALGMPVYDHSFYQQFKIEAATLRGLKKDDFSIVDSYKFGRAVECSLYSLNTLLERLHHSFWFYLLATPNQVVLLSIYIGPVIAVSAALIFYGIYLWFGSPGRKAVVTEEVVDGKYYKRPAAVKVHSANSHDSATHLIAFSKVFLHSWGLFYFGSMLFEVFPEGYNGYTFSDLILFFMILSRFKKGFIKVPKLDFQTGKSIACLGIGMMLISLATINPSLSILFALPLVPTFLSLSKHSLLSYSLLLLSFPVDALVICSLLNVDILGIPILTVTSFFKTMVNDWILHGHQLYSLICCLYYPWILIGFILVGNNE